MVLVEGEEVVVDADEVVEGVERVVASGHHRTGPEDVGVGGPGHRQGTDSQQGDNHFCPGDLPPRQEESMETEGTGDGNE